MRYLIVIEKTKNGFSAFSPDVPGCAATAKTKKSVETRMRQVIRFHMEGLRLEGLRLPKPNSYSTHIRIAA